MEVGLNQSPCEGSRPTVPKVVVGLKTCSSSSSSSLADPASLLVHEHFSPFKQIGQCARKMVLTAEHNVGAQRQDNEDCSKGNWNYWPPPTWQDVMTRE
jgi:hypothetical protein